MCVLCDHIIATIKQVSQEKMFDLQINCLFQRKRKMLEQTEKDLVEFLLQATVDIKHHLKYRSHAESIDLPNGYIESPYPPPANNTYPISFKFYGTNFTQIL